MTRLSIAVGAAVIALAAGCGGQDAPAADPYETYLENAPAGAPKLSREDAQARAMLGCGEKWAPGTVDAVLADAYQPDC